MTATTMSALRERAEAAYRARLEADRRRADEKAALNAARFRVDAASELQAVLGVAVVAEDVAVTVTPDGSLIARAEIDGLPLEVWPVRCGRTAPQEREVRLAVPCPEGCGMWVTGPRVRTLADLGRHLAEPPEASACGDCLDLIHGTPDGEV